VNEKLQQDGVGQYFTSRKASRTASSQQWSEILTAERAARHRSLHSQLQKRFANSGLTAILRPNRFCKSRRNQPEPGQYAYTFSGINPNDVTKRLTNTAKLKDFGASPLYGQTIIIYAEPTIDISRDAHPHTAFPPLRRESLRTAYSQNYVY
jgi:hypothetical protein